MTRKRIADLLVPLLVALTGAATIVAQSASPNDSFVQALAAFSVALDGAYGDEGAAIRSSLDALEDELRRWEESIRASETGMAAELSRAEPPVAARMHIALGGAYLYRSRAADAVREFALATKLDPGRPDPHTLRALAQSQLTNEPAAAAEAFRQAAALDPQNPVLSYGLARQLLKIGQSDQARNALQAFQANWARHVAQPGSTRREAPFIRLGLVQEKTGVDPFFPPALYADGFALLRQGDYQRAITRLRAAISRDPLAAQPVDKMEAMGRAAAAFRDGSLAEAIGRLHVAIELTPNRAEAHRMLGRVYQADQQYDDAVDEFKAAVTLAPGDERARLGLANALVQSGQDQAAEQVLRDTIKAVPASGKARYTLGRLHQRKGQYSEALQELDDATTFGPLLGLNGIYQSLGAMNASQQRFDAAIDAYEKRVDVHPNDPGAHQDLGETYDRVGRHIEALAEFTAVLILNPADADAYAAMAQIHLKDGRFADAADTARQALQVDPAHKQAHYALATSLMRLGETDAGKRELEIFEQLQAEAAAAHARELELNGIRRDAEVSSASGDHAKAVALFRRALALEPSDAVSHLNLGLALLNAGQPAEAVDRFKSAVALNAHFDVHHDLAEAYAALGQLDDSRREEAIYEQMRQESLRRGGASR